MLMIAHRRRTGRGPSRLLRMHVAAGLGLVLGLTATTAPATAGTPDCVSRAEYREVHLGMSRSRVHRVFDTRGTFEDGAAGGYIRVYRGCWLAAGIFVTYRDPGTLPHRVVEKTVVPLYFEGDCPNGICASRPAD